MAVEGKENEGMAEQAEKLDRQVAVGSTSPYFSLETAEREGCADAVVLALWGLSYAGCMRWCI